MFTLIRDAEVYTPQKAGKMDILLCNDRIIKCGANLRFRDRELREIDARGRIAVPGLIDQHVHVTGGGGEDGFRSRIREISLEQLIRGGITTVVGLLGTDGTTRSVENLLAKTKALNEEGVTAYCLTGSYEYPSPTLTGSVAKDILFVQEILGLKLAISDHRGSQLTEQELIRAFSEVRRASLLSGKPGLVCLHTGTGKEGLSQLIHIAETTEIPISLMRPTHAARVPDDAIRFAAMGGWIDFTASGNPQRLAKRLCKVLEQADLTRVTFSSDGNGSSPRYDESRQLVGMGVGDVSLLWKNVRAFVQLGILPLEKALPFITLNPARALGLEKRKGFLAPGADADLVLLKDMEIDAVIAKGELMMENGQILRHGYYTYEQES